MGKYLITGSPGAGKSTIVRALRQLGFQAFDTESMAGVTKLEERATGKTVPWPEPPVDWSVYSFNWQEKGVKRLLAMPGDVYLAASVSNQDLFYPLLDTIFVLKANPDVLKKRLASRKKKFGKLPEELRGILDYHQEREASYLRQPNALELDASKPVQTTIQAILDYAENHR